MSMTTWIQIGYPSMSPLTGRVWAFNGRTSKTEGTCPDLPITLAGKTVYLDVTIMTSKLDYNILLGRDYIHAM